MKRKSLIVPILATALLISVWPNQCLCYFYSGNSLVELAREYEKDDADHGKIWSSAGLFSGYVLGVCDVTGHLYSIPEAAPGEQICAVVAKYLKEHPEKWSDAASDLVISALKEAFPKRK